ncbi:MAG: BACON domain-containing protein [Phycisphaerales bacterium]|nr:BACON domain-containing protein [Phycisphaerales bacterium]
MPRFLNSARFRGACAAIFAVALVTGGCPPSAGTDDPLDDQNNTNGVVPDNWTGGGGGDTQVAGTTDQRVAAFSTIPSILDFGDVTSEMAFELRGIATTEVPFDIVSSQPWATVNPSSGTLGAGTSRIVTVTIDRSSFLPGGYSADIDITSDGFLPARVTLDATSTGSGGGGAGDGPLLHVSVDSLSFGSTSTSRSFLVRNRGDGELAYALSADATWITFNTSEGTSAGEYDTIRANANRDGLAPGDYSATITVTAADQQHTIAVTMTVPQPSSGSGSTPPNLTVSRTELVFSATQRRVSVLLRNTGSGELNFTVNSSESWAIPSMAYGVARRTYTTLSVNVDRAGLTDGEYTGVLAIVAENGQRFDLNMRMTVAAGGSGGGADPPVLEVSTTTLNFGASTTTVSFSMRNSGGGTLNHTTMSDQSWLTVTPTSGVVSPTVTVVRGTVNRSGLTENMYSGNITIAADNGETVTVQVAMQVGDGVPDSDPPAPANPLFWTSSDERIDSIGGLQQYAAEGVGGRYGYPPERWAYSPVQLWLSIPFQEGFTPSSQYEQMVELLQGYNPDAIWLSAVSGSAVRRLEDMTSYPGEMMLYELIPEAYLAGPYDDTSYARAEVDLSIPDARQLMSDLIVQEILARDCRGVFLDNIVHRASGGTTATWVQMTDYLRSITSRLNEAGKLTIANIAIVPQSLTYLADGHDDERAADSLNGVCFETPFHWNLTRSHWEKVVSEIDMYRRWMDGGMHVELLPAWSTVVWDQQLRNAEARVLAAMVMMIRRPGDSICVPRTYYEEIPDWAFWPQAFGAALDDYIITLQPVTLTREFENCTVTVNLTMSMDPAQSMNAVTIVWR